VHTEDSSLMEVPDSFIAIHSVEHAGRVRKLSMPLADLRERHEFCEDLAQALIESSRARLLELKVTEEDVLRKVLAGLAAAEGVVSAAEASWVVRRLAELQRWEPLVTA
jgi:hypothetical protein